jgi:hypothetical protein
MDKTKFYVAATFAVGSLIFWVPIVAILLWMATFVTGAVTFSWVVVTLVAGIASLISGALVLVNEPKTPLFFCGTPFVDSAQDKTV